MIGSSIAAAHSISLYGPHSLPALCSLFGILFLIAYLSFTFLHLSHHRAAQSTVSVSSNSVTFKSFNTYQRAQTMLTNRQAVFKFNRSSGDLTALYQQELEKDSI
jgi:hypothetical protein